jgi:hypothetical protein
MKRADLAARILLAMVPVIPAGDAERLSARRALRLADALTAELDAEKARSALRRKRDRWVAAGLKKKDLPCQ